MRSNSWWKAEMTWKPLARFHSSVSKFHFTRRSWLRCYSFSCWNTEMLFQAFFERINTVCICCKNCFSVCGSDCIHAWSCIGSSWSSIGKAAPWLAISTSNKKTISLNLKVFRVAQRQLTPFLTMDMIGKAFLASFSFKESPFNYFGRQKQRTVLGG